VTTDEPDPAASRARARARDEASDAQRTLVFAATAPDAELPRVLSVVLSLVASTRYGLLRYSSALDA